METSAANTLPASSDQFSKSIAESGLMSAAAARQAVAEVPQAKRSDTRALAQELVKRQKLTRFQATMLLQGKTKGLVLDNYVILEELGKGGMGVVYKARHRGLGRVVALKVLSSKVGLNKNALNRFRREIHAVAKLNHPHIVAALDAGEHKGVHFLVMDYVEGSDLARKVQKDGPLPAGQAASSILQAAQGLAHAHAAGIIHRDIKPANLLVDSTGTVKILDLGLARIQSTCNGSGNEAPADELTKTGSIMGTCDYMAPEQAMNAKAADARADIYSLGCTLYFLTTGKAIYKGETAMERMFAHRENPIPPLPGASKNLQAVYRRMVAKQPKDRYPSIAELIVGLEKCAGKVKVNRTTRPRWKVRAAAAVAAALLLGLGFGYHWSNPSLNAPNDVERTPADAALTTTPIAVQVQPPAPTPIKLMKHRMVPAQAVKEATEKWGVEGGDPEERAAVNRQLETLRQAAEKMAHGRRPGSGQPIQGGGFSRPEPPAKAPDAGIPNLKTPAAGDAPQAVPERPTPANPAPRRAG